MISMWMSGSSCCDLLGVYIDSDICTGFTHGCLGLVIPPAKSACMVCAEGLFIEVRILFDHKWHWWKEFFLQEAPKRSKLPHFFLFLSARMTDEILLQADIPTKFCRSCRSALARSWGIESLQRVYLNPCRSLGLWRNVAKSETVESEGLPSTKSLWEWVLNLLWASDWELPISSG